MFTQLITYCKEVMTKNQHTLLVAYFLPSIFVQLYIPSTSFMASQRRQVIHVLLRAGWPLCHSYELSLMLLHTFS